MQVLQGEINWINEQIAKETVNSQQSTVNS